MGGWASRIWWGGDPDLVNSISGLTRRDIYAVQKSWKLVYANSAGNGIELLKRLFRAYPATKDFFRIIEDVPEDEYCQNHKFKAHVINLMSYLNLAITNLNSPEMVVVLMNKLGDSHEKRNIKQKNFEELKEVLVQMLIEVLKLDSTTLDSWGKTVDFLYKHIYETLNSSEKR